MESQFEHVEQRNLAGQTQLPCYPSCRSILFLLWNVCLQLHYFSLQTFYRPVVYRMHSGFILMSHYSCTSLYSAFVFL